MYCVNRILNVYVYFRSVSDGVVVEARGYGTELTASKPDVDRPDISPSCLFTASTTLIPAQS